MLPVPALPSILVLQLCWTFSRSSGAIDTDEAALLWDSWDFDVSIGPSKDMKLALAS
jgi:hypothetical protein